MENIEWLNDLIYNRIIEKNGNVKLTENTDIVLYAKSLGISESQLVFKILEIEETIDWTTIEKMKRQEEISKTVTLNTPNGNNTNLDSNIIKCKNCNAENEKGVANFCVECGSEIKQEPEPIYQPTPSYESIPVYEPEIKKEQNRYSEPEIEETKKSKMPLVIGAIGFVLL